MPESNHQTYVVIPEHLMLSRLEQSEQMREFFIQMWIQNPVMARQGGAKVQRLLSPLVDENSVKFCNSSSGLTTDIEGE